MTGLIYRHPNPEFLEGLAAIADFLGIRKEDAKRAILREGLPAIRLPEGQFFTTKKCIMAWTIQGYEQEMKERDGRIAATLERAKARDKSPPGEGSANRA